MGGDKSALKKQDQSLCESIVEISSVWIRQTLEESAEQVRAATG